MYIKGNTFEIVVKRAESDVKQSNFRTWRRAIDFINPTKGYPGDSCITDKDCMFGQKRCGSNAACQGVSRYGACRQSADCVLDHFCSYGHCIPILTQGSACTSSEDCGREGICLFTQATKFGVCTNILSLETGAPILYKVDNKKIIYTEGAEKACRTAWIDKIELRGSEGLQSKNKGISCN